MNRRMMKQELEKFNLQYLQSADVTIKEAAKQIEFLARSLV